MPGGRARRRRDARRRASHRAVPLALDEQANGPLRRLAGEPLPLRTHGLRGDQAPGRRSLSRRFPLRRRRGRGEGDHVLRRLRRHRQDLRAQRLHRLLQCHLRPHGHRKGARRAQHAGDGLADRPLAEAGRRLQARGRPSRFSRGARLRHLDRALRDPRGTARHGGDDARAHRRSLYRRQTARGPGKHHTALRRRDPLPVAAPPGLPAQPVERTRTCPAARHRPVGQAGAEDRRRRRRSRRARGGAGRRGARAQGGAVRSRQPARRSGADGRPRQLAQGSHRPGRLAQGGARAARSRYQAQRLRRARGCRCGGTRCRRRCHRRHAGSRLARRRRALRQRVGRAHRQRPARHRDHRL